MAALRKMLGKADSPHILELKRLIETQSKHTLANWSMDYAETVILPIYEKDFPDDFRPRAALAAARRWLDKKAKLPEVKALILDVHAAAREAEGHPAAQAAARTVGQAAATIHSARHSIGIAFYGAAAVAYATAGLNEPPEVYDEIAARECAKMQAALQAVAVPDEKNPAKIIWHC